MFAKCASLIAALELAALGAPSAQALAPAGFEAS